MGQDKRWMVMLVMLSKRGLLTMLCMKVVGRSSQSINQSKRKTSYANGRLTNLGHKHKAPDHNHGNRWWICHTQAEARATARTAPRGTKQDH